MPEVDPLSLLIGKFDGLEKRMDRLEEVIDSRFRSHGERVGRVEQELKEDLAGLASKLSHHLEVCRNGKAENGWKTKGTYAGGGVVLFEAIHRILEALTK